MRRREFITLLGGAAVASPFVARAQAMPVIGFLAVETPNVFADRVRAFRQGLSEMGYVEGRNVSIMFQWAGGNYDLLRTHADELVRQRVSVLVAAGTTQAAHVAKAATATIPIVFLTGGEPVAAGLVTSLNRPGGNLTGIAGLSAELLPKRLELLHEAVPAATSLAVLLNPGSSLTDQVKLAKDAVNRLGLDLHLLNATSEREFDEVFLKVLQLRAGALATTGNPLFVERGGEKLGALSVRYRVPAVSLTRDFVAAGGLMSYGGGAIDNMRLVGIYTGRILKGEKPADLPVQQPTKFELFLNLKTAKALGLTLPLSLLVRADGVIE